jgi:DNA-directed RNA polymerase subunit RPC12/RpoP
VKTLRSHLEDRYSTIGRVAKPIWFAVWLLFIALMATSLRWWATGAAGIVFITYLILIAQIECPRCAKRLGLLAQTQPGGRRRQGLPLQDIRCPHCRLMLDEPFERRP